MNFNKFFLIKISSSFLLSVLVFLTFRIDLFYVGNNKILLSFGIIQAIIWSIIFLPKGKVYKIIIYNSFFLIFLNLILTPSFHLLTTDVPIRQPNTKITKEYKSNFFKGMYSRNHTISYDKKGNRTNKKIDYENKKDDVIRIVTIGASTTENGNVDDNKIWSNLLGENLEKATNKNIEVINTGVAGLRSEHHYITFKRIKNYNADLIIFLIGINDWNHHIINSNKKYLFPYFEIKYEFKKSIFYNIFKNINKQIKRKYNKMFNTAKNSSTLEEVENVKLDEFELFLLKQINSAKSRNIVKKFKPNEVSQEYFYWLNLIINNCNKVKAKCLFVDQPVAYQENISSELKDRLWMTPPSQNFSLPFENLIYLSNFYNEFLQKIIQKNNLNFCLLSNKFDPTTENFIDDCHYSEKGLEKVSNELSNYIISNFKLFQ